MPRPRAHAPNKQGGKPAGQDKCCYTGAALDMAELTKGSARVPSEIRLDHRVPPCFTALRICDFDILISTPVLFFIALLNILI